MNDSEKNIGAGESVSPTVSEAIDTEPTITESTITEPTDTAPTTAEPADSATASNTTAPTDSTASGTVKAEAGQHTDGQNGRHKEPMTRRTKRGIVTGVICVLVIAAVVLVNIIASVMTAKIPALTADITGLKSFELSDTTKDIISGLDKNVSIAFMSDRDTYTAIDPYCKQTAILCEEMEKLSGGSISVEYADIVRNPSAADSFSADSLSTTDIVLTCGANKRILKAANIFTFEQYSGNYSYITSSKAEQEIDNALLAVSTGTVINAAVITDGASEDRTYFISTLNSDGYKVTEVTLANGDIPADTQLAVVFTPSVDFSEDAVQKLRMFLENDGRYGKSLLYIASPSDAKTPQLDKLISEYGMEVQGGFAFEADGSRINSSSSNYFDGVLCSYASELYSENLRSPDRPVIAGYARPIFIKNSGIAHPLLAYSQYSGLCPFSAGDDWDYLDAITGNMFVLAQGALGKDGSFSTVIVSGSDKIFSRSYYGSDYSNREYLSTMLSSVNGRTQQLVSIPAKVISSYDISIDKQTALNIGFIVYALIPIIILGAGFTVFLMRRNR